MNRIEFNFHLSNLNNNNKSLEALYNEFYGVIVYHIKKNFKTDIAFGEDIAHDFFCYLIKLETKPYIRHPHSWVIKSCNHIAIKKLNDRNKFVEYNDEQYADSSFDEEVIYGEFNEKIQKLDLESQQIMRFRYIYKYSLEEIANIMKLKSGTVRQKLARAKEKVKNM